MKIKELLATPESWTQRAFARDHNGFELNDVNHPHAVCWCFQGAINKCYEDSIAQMIVETKIAKHLNFRNLIVWNDNQDRTHNDVLNLATTLDI